MKTIRKNSDTVIIRNEILEKYLKDIKNFKSLTQEEEHTLIASAKQGDVQARHKVVQANLKFVVMVAKEYQVRGQNINEIINAGNIGLIEAVDKFQLTNKVKFISYAVWWIKNHIIEHIKENGSIVRLPFNKQTDIENFLKSKERIEAMLEGTITAEQVFSLTGAEFNEDLRSALLCSMPINSLDQPIDHDESPDTLGETVSGEFVDPLKDEYKLEMRAMLMKAIGALTPTQQKVIVLAFGLTDEIGRSNEDIADQLDLTAERVRQIKDIALKKLKTNNGNALKTLL